MLLDRLKAVGRCKGCGVVMRGRKRKYCTGECREEYAVRKTYEKTCERKQCGRRYTTKTKKVRFCSMLCAQRARPGFRNQERLCQQCGKLYWPKNPVRVTYCSRICSYQHRTEQGRYLRDMKGWAAKYYYHQVWIDGFVRACEACGSEFVTARRDKKTCSDWRCQQGLPMKCLKCGTDRDFNKSYCARCRLTELRENKSEGRRRRRARILGNQWESFKRREVFERDGYRCQQCGCKTRPDWDVNHDRFPHLDHIVPIARGGAHSKLNTQCLCRRCNMAKGARVGGDQLRLIG